jgi:hypothetical protein
MLIRNRWGLHPLTHIGGMGCPAFYALVVFNFRITRQANNITMMVA